MAANITENNIVILLNGSLEFVDKFKILQVVSRLMSDEKKASRGRECLLRILNKKKEFKGYESIIRDMLRQEGLFPYLNEDELSFQDVLAYEFHKPEGLNNVVFHKVQAQVYTKLMNDENIILSAPTSFGKSLIIDAVIASQKYSNIMIIVPSIALIDETRKRLAYFRKLYKIITHPTQEREKRNVYVLTQERAIEIVNDVDVDFFVIDEFYKLDERCKNDRCIILNYVLYSLLKKNAHFYMLGPNIENVDQDSIKRFKEFNFIRTDYATVISQTKNIKVTGDDDKLVKLLELVSTHKDEQTLIYCSSPKSANTVANAIYNKRIFNYNQENRELSDWLRDNYNEDWALPKCIDYNIGIHHGKMPRSIAQRCVKMFNNSQIKVLACTSTLIEGVNTSAKNVIVFDNTLAGKKINFFTFSNIKGRSGRMKRHLIGNVYIFKDPPESKLPFVDFPILSEDDDMPDEMLINVDFDDLTEVGRERIIKYSNQNLLSVDILRKNSYIDLNKQLSFALRIEKDIYELSKLIIWRNYPTYEQLTFLCQAIWDLSGQENKSMGVSSGKQLAYKINRYKMAGNIKNFISESISQKCENIDQEIESALDFQRKWLNFRLPRDIMAVQNIINDVLTRHKMTLCDYSHYACMVECYFTKPFVVPLDEYGLPIQISLKIGNIIKLSNDLDEVLDAIKHFDYKNANLSSIEKTFIADVQKYI